MKTKRSSALLLALMLLLALVPWQAARADGVLTVHCSPAEGGKVKYGTRIMSDGVDLLQDHGREDIEALPESGYTFSHWEVQGDGLAVTNADEPSSSLVIIDTFTGGSLTAVFKPKHTVTVVGGTADKASAAPGETVTVTATVPDGQGFAQWASDDGVTFAEAQSTVTTFTMPDKPVTVTAVCRDILIEIMPRSYTYTGQAITPDVVKVSLDGVDLALARGVDYRIDFQDNEDAGPAKVIVTMSDDHGGQSATATFQITPANIADADVTVPDQKFDGTEKMPMPTVTWKGKTLEMGKDYEIIGYTDNVNVGTAYVSLEGEGNFTGRIESPFTIFQNLHTVSAVAEPPEGGTVTGGGTYGIFATATLIATPAEDYSFSDWEMDGKTVSREASYSFTVTEDVELIAHFNMNLYTVEVTDDGNGTASADLFYGPRGQEVKLTAQPNQGYAFKEWQVLEGGVTITDDKFTIGTEDVEIKAVFEPIVYTVTLTDDGNGTATADPASGNMGQEVKLTAKPSQGYAFKEWQVLEGGVTVTNDAFTIGTENVEIRALFEKVEYTVSEGGGASYRLKSGKALTLTVTRSPNDDACFGHFTGVEIDGNPVSDFTAAAGSTIVTLNPAALDGLKTGDHTVAVLFDDGSVETTVKILAAYDDETGVGDNSHMFLWLGLTVCACMGLGALCLTRRKWTEG